MIAGLVRRLTPGPVARAVSRCDTLLDPYALKSYSQEGEDVILLRMFESRRSGFYVDVGAHHPRRFSNTFLLYQRGWRGINIDPNPAAIELFKAQRPRDISIALAISNEPGTLTYFVFDDPALNTLDESLARERERATTYRIVRSQAVPVARLDSVLGEHLASGEAIDFMSVDAEGYDFRVVQSNDWTRFRPRCLLVECLESSLSSLSGHPLHRFLEERGYEIYAKTVNTVFYLDARCSG
jgi:FkbM family methyltransferase